MKGYDHVELRIVDYGAHGTDVDSLAVTHFALAPLVVKEISANRYELCLEEISQFATEFGPSLSEVE